MNKIFKIFLFLFALLPFFAQAVVLDFGEVFSKGKVQDIVRRIGDIIFWAGIAIFVLMVLLGAYYILTSGGEPEKVNKGKRVIVWAFVAILIISFGKAIPSLLRLFLVSGPPAPKVANPFQPPVADKEKTKDVGVNKKTSQDGSIFVFHTNPIYSLSITGQVTISQSDGFARVILVDNEGREYLVFEAQGPYDSGTFTFKNHCEETCVLDGVVPKSVNVEISGASISVLSISFVEDKNALEPEVLSRGIENYRQILNRYQKQAKIDYINQYIKEHNLRWIAGETSVSHLSFAEKKKLFGLKSGEKLPNLFGIEYYKGGIFETERVNQPLALDDLPKSFDWRKVHGENWLTPVKDQGRCGSCWAFAAVGTAEALANVFYNRHLNLDLAEQELVSCFTGARGCQGLPVQNVGLLFQYLGQTGVTYEYCFPYAAANLPCVQRCSEAPSKRVRVKGEFVPLSPNQVKEIKEMLITQGPMFMAIPGHAIVLVGYETDPKTGSTVWIYKNSWGPGWGENGYGRTTQAMGFWALKNPKVEILDNPNLQIECVDKDNDGYCNWGISPTKPSTCPSFCKPEKDCNDSDPTEGPFLPNYKCKVNDEIPPQVGQLTFPSQIKEGQSTTFQVQVSDNRKVERCDLLSTSYCQGSNCEKKEVNWGTMTFNQTPCKSCTASITLRNLSAGTYKFYVKCWDDAENIGTSTEAEVKVLPATCPKCTQDHVDLCESPPKCKSYCKADQSCDNKQPNTSWMQGDTCLWCGSSCNFNSTTSKPANYKFIDNYCYYNCLYECKVGGWQVATSTCQSEHCPPNKYENNVCYTQGTCTEKGCKYENREICPPVKREGNACYINGCSPEGCKPVSVDYNRACRRSKCTQNGWDNSSCPTPSNTSWVPCDFSEENWKCGKMGKGKCEGEKIAWQAGDEGEAICPEGTIALGGICKGGEEKVTVKEEGATFTVLPENYTLSTSTTFKLFSSYRCKFGCQEGSCRTRGCGWAQCAPASDWVQRIRLRIFDSSDNLVYTTLVSNTSTIVWDGKDRDGNDLPDGVYTFTARVYLIGRAPFTVRGIIEIKR